MTELIVLLARTANVYDEHDTTTNACDTQLYFLAKDFCSVCELGYLNIAQTNLGYVKT